MARTKTYLKPVHVGNALGFTPQAIVNMARKGKLDELGPVFVTARHVRFDPDKLAEFIARGGNARKTEGQRCNEMT